MSFISNLIGSQFRIVVPIVVGSFLSLVHYFFSQNHCSENDMARYFFASFTLVTGVQVLSEAALKPSLFSETPIHRLFSSFGSLVMIKFGIDSLIEANPKDFSFNQKEK